MSQILIPFGFTSLESEIYTFLLSESPATGYRVAQALGKAAANIYKSIESLQQKGAVLVEEGSSRLCRAVPSDELLARLTRDFEWKRAEAELLLSRLNSAGEDDRVYSLRSRAQVIERARHMLGAATRVALVSCSAAVAGELSDAFASAIRHGARVYLLCSEQVVLAGVESARAPEHRNELRMAVDEREHLLALFALGKEDVEQAIWTSSAFLSGCTHRGLVAEMQIAGLSVRA